MNSDFELIFSSPVTKTKWARMLGVRIHFLASFIDHDLVFVPSYQLLPVITGDGLERLDFHNF